MGTTSIGLRQLFFEAEAKLNTTFLKQALNCNIITAHEFDHILQ